MTPEMIVCADLPAVAQRAAERIKLAASETRGRFKVCVDGGRPTQALFPLLGQGSLALDPEHSEVYLGDERCVPAGDKLSNRTLVERLLFAPMRERKPAFFAPDGANPNPESAAWDFEELWRAKVGDDGADVHLLGMGPDGHTASIFPGSHTMDETARWVLSVAAPTTVDPKVPRLTLTPLAILRAKRIILFAVGAEKREALKRVLAETGSEQETPARLIHRYQGVPIILADKAAAG